MKAVILNRILLVVGIVGLPICIAGARKAHSVPFLLGIGLFGYLLLSSIIVVIRGAIRK